MIFEIIPDKLYLSNLSSADCIRYKITHAVNLSESNESVSTKTLLINIQDKPHIKIQEHFQEANDFIDKAISDGGRVLVYCHAGVSRSATIVISYLIEKCNISLRQAYLYVLSIKNDICPNIGFFKALQEFEVKLFGLEGPSFSTTDYYTKKLSKIYGFEESKIRNVLTENNIDENETIRVLLSEFRIN